MKKRRIIFFVVIVAFGLFVSCKPETFNSFGNIAGTVIDVDTGDPVALAKITLTPTSKNAETGSDGQFEFKNLESGQYTLRVQTTGYRGDSQIANVIAGETLSVVFMIKKNQ